MQITNKHITDMQRQIDACSSYIDALAQGCRSPEKVNTLLDAAMQKIESACIDMRRFGGTEYISDTISRLLNRFKDSGGDIPMFDKAFLAIAEHAPMEASGAFDHDNKGFKAVINALKGRLFPDDNQFEMSLGLFTAQDEDACCHIYGMPFESAGDFLYQMSDELL